MKFSNKILIAVVITLVLQCTKPTEPEEVEPLDPMHSGEPRTIHELEQYTFEKVNQSRTGNGTSLIIWDDIAADAGRKHAQELANHGYLSPINLSGKGPCQCYTEAGGEDAVF